MAYAYLTAVTNSGAVSGPITTTSVDTTGATLIVFHVACNTGTTPTVSDSAGNSWGTATSTDALGCKSMYFLCRNPTTSGSHTFTVSGTNIFAAVHVVAFTGTVPTTFVDQTGTPSSNSGVTSLQTGSVTPTENDELVLAFISRNQVGSFSVNGGFTVGAQTNGVSSTAFAGAVAYLIQTTAAAAQPTFSWSPTASAVTQIVTLKVTAGGGGGSSPHRSLSLVGVG